jgi:hypothetical protein
MSRSVGNTMIDRSLRAEQGIGSTVSERAENGWSGDSTRIYGGGSLGVVAAARRGFAPPVPGSRVELIVGVPIADTTVVLEEMATDEFAAEAEAVVPVVDEIPADDEPRGEVRPDGVPVGDAYVDEVQDDTARIDDVQIEDGSLDDVTPAARPADEAGDVGDDFWTGAASEQSVPTRKVVYGARSTDGGTKHHGWLRSVRRHRR